MNYFFYFSILHAQPPFKKDPIDFYETFFQKNHKRVYK
ncbi:hypothetical protein ADIARSV_1851 [Arcticibacter svalbardensis MN12-7]|uniref:Uncharacterized protein n=1 Tax=Arcticibacter svalbardensis MN12-7 TaxID=1150600 RepID=R9GTV7_9SPHI|nr:hypothetical protein ADIARSV_1851 [Arcticibacter svalbardensis MN12-7]